VLVLQGVGISCFNPKQKQYPIINAIDAAKDSKSKEDAKYFSLCFPIKERIDSIIFN
jgi:hypothetical protein